MPANERRIGGKTLVLTFLGSVIGVSVAIYIIAKVFLITK